MALVLDLQRVAAGGFSLPALQWLGFVEVASQTPAGIGAPDPHSSKDKDSQKLPEEAGRDSSPCRLSRHVAEELLKSRNLITSLRSRVATSEREAKRENPLWVTLYSSFVFPTPAPSSLPLSPPALQEDALGVGFASAASALRRRVNDDWQLLKALFQHLAVTTPHTSAA